MLLTIALAALLQALHPNAHSPRVGGASPSTQVPLKDPPKGLMPNLGRPTKADDVVPLLDFDQYFLGNWRFAADAPDSVLGAGGEISGTVSYRKTGDGFYEARYEGKSDSGKFTITETIAYHREQKVAFRHVVDSRGYTYTQMADVGGNIGGDYRLFFQSAPFSYKGKQVRLNHTVYLAAPLTFRVDVEVAEGTGPFIHMSPWRFNKVR
jgi:hypothetical protein